jgi:hypothetical protein
MLSMLCSAPSKESPPELFSLPQPPEPRARGGGRGGAGAEGGACRLPAARMPPPFTRDLPRGCPDGCPDCCPHGAPTTAPSAGTALIRVTSTCKMTLICD